MSDVVQQHTPHSGSEYVPAPEGPADEHPSEELPPASRRSTVAVAVVASMLVVATAAVVWTLATHRSSALAAEAHARTSSSAAGAVVRTAIVTLSPAVRTVDLLGEARPFASVTLYAKVAGYLKSVTVDVGDRVQAGQVIGAIESPETDRALSAAQADYDNKQLTASRVSQLLARKLVSPQEADQAKTDATVAGERLAGLKEQQGYEMLRAPFPGRVTARFADPGALVQSAASSQTSALPVVTVSQTDRLRVFAYLDQADASIVRPGTRASIALPEHQDAPIPVTVSRVSGELDPKTRKMLAELDVENGNGAIVPGSFVQVKIDLPSKSQPEAPVEALLVRDNKTFVAVVDGQDHVHLAPVVVASNDGHVVTFASGVASGALVALNLGGGIADGERVQVTAGAPGGPVK